MPCSGFITNRQTKHIRDLVLIFIGWKFLLILTACLSPGIGYDTSTDLFLASKDNSGLGPVGWKGFFVRLLAAKLVRWDSLYFISVAENGYRFEQEWAFGWGFPALVRGLALTLPNSVESPFREVLMAILVANMSHLLSVVLLYFLCRTVAGRSSDKFPFLSACLHIFAPAGIFLCSPNGESLFALLNFGGYLCYANSRPLQETNGSRSHFHELALLASGVLFGLASTVRSNGLFSGLIFLYDLFAILLKIPSMRDLAMNLEHIICIIIAGISIAVGFTTPQYYAYVEMCMGKESYQMARPWCNRIPPSIYTYVQQHYWGVGFLRYWTVSNAPLFALALPMLSILLVSATWAFQTTSIAHRTHQVTRKSPRADGYAFEKGYLTRLALPQVLLGILAITSFHVQVITRLASAYPLPYFWIAKELIDGQTDTQRVGRNVKTNKWIVRWMVMYALVQGGLFASFLPPA